MKPFHFSKTYFNTLKYDDFKSNIRVIINETPSLEISEEDYSLRIETFHEEEIPIHRNYAIEHHSKFDKHNYPHLQFKFHTEEIGTFWLRLNLKDSEEYRRAILGFIYKIKNVLIHLEKFRKGICEEIMILNLVNELEKEGGFLSKKISESIEGFEYPSVKCQNPQKSTLNMPKNVDYSKSSILENELEFQDEGIKSDKIKKLKENMLLIDFLGESTIKKVIESYEEKK